MNVKNIMLSRLYQLKTSL